MCGCVFFLGIPGIFALRLGGGFLSESGVDFREWSIGRICKLALFDSLSQGCYYMSGHPTSMGLPAATLHVLVLRKPLLLYACPVDLPGTFAVAYA